MAHFAGFLRCSAPQMAVLVCAGALLSAMPLQAQVLRCTDVRTGEVTYTDGSCDAGAQTRQVQARQSPEDLARERAQAEDAAQRMRERLAAEAAAEQQRDSQTARAQEDARRAKKEPSLADYASSAACADARRALDSLAASTARSGPEGAARLDAAQRQMDFSCLGPEGYARTEAARASRPQVVVLPAPAWPVRPRLPHRPDRPDRPDRPYIKECTSFTCTDSNGKRYPRTGRGSFEAR